MYSNVFPKIKSIISHFYTETFFPLKTEVDLKSFQSRFNLVLKEHLEKKLQIYRKITNNSEVFDVMKYAVELVCEGGKRVRPYMFYLANLSEGGTDTEETLKLAISLELFHAFALIHDDIIDRGTERHGKLTTHVYTEKAISAFPRGDKKHIAEGMTILAGDLMFSWSQEIIGKSHTQELKDIFYTMVDEVVAGQTLDVTFMLQYEVTSESIARKNELKTALYSFVNPMLMGSVHAQSHVHDQFYREFGLIIGQAFQIQDDLLDITGSSKKLGKNTFSDIKDGQHTFLSQYVFESADIQGKDLLRSLFGKELDDHARSALTRLFTSSGAAAYASKKVSTLITEARTLIDESTFKTVYKKRWHDFVNLLEHRNS